MEKSVCMLLSVHNTMNTIKLGALLLWQFTLGCSDCFKRNEL